jgi:hypothetical protein
MSFFSSVSTPVLAAPKTLEQFKMELTAVPSGLVTSRATNRNIKRRVARGNRQGKRGNKLPQIPDELIVSKTFNPVASRPLAMSRVNVPQIQCILSYASGAFFTSSTTITALAAFSFAISSFASYADYLTVFDQYRFDGIEVWIEPLVSQSSVNAVVGSLVSTIDVDDGTTPSNFNTVIDHQSAIVSTGEAGHYHRWRPHMAVAVYSGAFTSFSNAPAGWIDSGSPNVQHYGLKLAQTATNTAISYNLTVRAVISFRSPGI